MSIPGLEIDLAMQEVIESKRKLTKVHLFVRTVRVLSYKDDTKCICIHKRNYRKNEDFLEGFGSVCEEYEGYLVELLDMKGNILLDNGVKFN